MMFHVGRPSIFVIGESASATRHTQIVYEFLYTVLDKMGSSSETSGSRQLSCLAIVGNCQETDEEQIEDRPVQDWRTLEAWHTLFDLLCVQRGWYDNTHLASELCAFAGKGTQQDFEAAKKKLRSWRSGRRLPLRRNLALIGELLGIAGDADLERRWYLLYRRAQALQKANSNPVDVVVGADTSARPSREAYAARGAASSLAVVLLCLTIAAGAWGTGRTTIGSALPSVDYVGHVRLPLGSSRIIHGSSGGCDGPLPTWQEINGTLPKTSLGAFTDGGVARKVVRRCGRELPVRAVLFTGLRTGIKEVVVLDDFIKIEVVETH